MRFIIAGALLILGTTLEASAASDQALLVGRDASIHGLKQSDYANMWWQWAVSMAKRDSPVSDMSGEKCEVNQVGPVWFLAGGYGSSKIHRRCSVPSDRYIFFPVINVLEFPQNQYVTSTCNSVKQGAALNNRYLASFRVVIDNHEYLNPALYRQSSEKCFDLAARKPANEYVRVYPSATDGYWIMLRPLAAGSHKLSFHAEYSSPGRAYGSMVQDIEYDLNIHKPK